MDHDRENPNHPQDTSKRTVLLLSLAILSFWGFLGVGIYLLVLGG